jgi:hypothetical protein
MAPDKARVRVMKTHGLVLRRFDTTLTPRPFYSPPGLSEFAAYMSKVIGYMCELHQQTCGQAPQYLYLGSFTHARLSPWGSEDFAFTKWLAEIHEKGFRYGGQPGYLPELFGLKLCPPVRFDEYYLDVHHNFQHHLYEQPDSA